MKWTSFIALFFFGLSLSSQGQNGFRVTGIWGGPNLTFSTFDNQGDLQVGGFLEVEISERWVLGARFSEPHYTKNRYKIGVWAAYREGYAKYLFGQERLRGYAGLGAGRSSFSPVILRGTENSNSSVFTPEAGIEYNIHRNIKIGAFAGYRVVGQRKFLVHPGDIPINTKDLSTPIFGVRISGGLNWRK